MATLQEIIIAARNIRAEMKLDQKKKIGAAFSSENEGVLKLVNENMDPLKRLANLSNLNMGPSRIRTQGSVVHSTPEWDIWITRGVITEEEKEQETAKLKKEIERLAKDIESKKARLADETFLSKAPPKIVDDLKATLAERIIEHQKLLDRLAQLE